METRRTIRGPGAGPTVKRLRELIEGVADDRVVTFSKFTDRPFDTTEWSMSVTADSTEP